MTSRVTYLGDLRTSSEHIASKDSFFTDAPLDNNGKGEAFSPTDTVATALASCMLTIMGIKARDLQVDLKGAVAQVTKTMAVSPRRISAVSVVVSLPKQADQKIKDILEKAALSCPVYHSLHPDMEKNISFDWSL